MRFGDCPVPQVLPFLLNDMLPQQEDTKSDHIGVLLRWRAYSQLLSGILLPASYYMSMRRVGSVRHSQWL